MCNVIPGSIFESLSNVDPTIIQGFKQTVFIQGGTNGYRGQFAPAHVKGALSVEQESVLFNPVLVT